jgi:beta-glucosidase
MPGKIVNGETGDVACDHYHRWQEDIALMHDLGLDAYRFSVSWPRIFPQGRGQANQAGLDFYERLVDGLLANNIQPFVTLYHWDLPQALQDEGGWANRDTALAFADYSEVVAKRLGDRVSAWITLNEPWVVAFVGNLEGRHAPGIADLGTTLRVTHHLLLGHGLAVPRLRAATPATPVGITLNLARVEPASDSQADRDAVTRREIYQNGIFLDPLVRGQYPEGAAAIFGEHTFPVQEGDLQTISAPLDFLGVNYYTRSVVRDAPGSGLLTSEQVKPAGEYTTMGWEVYPNGLCALLDDVHHDYAFPAYYITENGAAFPDVLGEDGAVHDDRRVAYLSAHFAAAAGAIKDGVPLRGYFIWSLMDNFEWALGYSQRFGTIYVDYPTQRRIPKDSALWYKRFLAAR